MGQTLSDAVRRLWGTTKLLVWPEDLWLVSFRIEEGRRAFDLLEAGAGFGALVRERDEISLTVSEDLWLTSPHRAHARAQEGPFRAVTLDLDLSLGICGYLAPAAERLARAEVSIVPQCAFLKDHLLVRARDLPRALGVLEEWIRACQSPGH